MLGNTRRAKPAASAADIKKAADLKKAKSGTNVVKEKTQLGTAASKRQGDALNDPTQKRRAAFGDITNALADKANIKGALKKSKLPTAAVVQTKPILKATTKKSKPKPVAPKETVSDDESSLSLVSSSQESSGGSEPSSQPSQTPADISCKGVDLIPLDEELNKTVEKITPPGVEDVDKENMQDPVQVALYAWDIFQYYKDREMAFKVEPYMSEQRYLTTSMRAILVDWLVEVQENFELNHETLYLAVKLVDMYVSRVVTQKESLQLVGAVSLFIASKFDERCPPLVEDFLYICDDAYKRKEFLDLERAILHAIGFDIGFPLSYRFLRRYAKCGRADMETLTLARYILEMSLMEYDFVHRRESQMAAATLYLALRMKNAGEWTPTLVHYTGYEASELTSIVKKLNHYISNPPKQLTTIRSKYSHRVFYEVAKIASLPDTDFV